MIFFVQFVKYFSIELAKKPKKFSIQNMLEGSFILDLNSPQTHGFTFFLYPTYMEIIFNEFSVDYFLNRKSTIMYFCNIAKKPTKKVFEVTYV